ncbi:MAG: S8 family peptidase [Bacteroidales bacterium]
MKRLMLFFIITCLAAEINVWGANKYVVFLKDKNNSPYTLSNPQEFLSQRAIERRNKFNIPFDEKDLPVTPSYISQIVATGAVALYPLKWINAVVIFAADAGILNAVATLPFVDHISPGNKAPHQSGKDRSAINQIGGIPPYSTGPPTIPSNNRSTGSLDYGTAWNQVSMIGLHNLHDMGYTGQDRMIAVLDAGFWDVDQGVAFSYLWQNNLIAGTRDFATPGGNVFMNHTHGESVLSIMGANLPGQIIGTAPDATYWLIRTEDAWGGESLLEEYNWAAGAELADSVGADIISSSLVYTTFDDPAYNHTYSDLNGNTTPITIASDRAASRGMLVINAEGNDGEKPWYYMGAPADGDSVFSIGAVDEKGIYQAFSGKGPTADGQIKPDVLAQGYNTAMIYGNGVLTVGTGTSFATPVISGALACLWQSVPAVSAEDIRNVVRNTASNSASPDNFSGWGIPNIMAARAGLISLSSGSSKALIAPVFSLVQNPFENLPVLKIQGEINSPLELEIFSANGKLLHLSRIATNSPKHMELKAFNNLPTGLYLIRLHDDIHYETLQAIKL